MLEYVLELGNMLHTQLEREDAYPSRRDDGIVHVHILDLKLALGGSCIISCRSEEGLG